MTERRQATPPRTGLIHYSDRGSKYAGQALQSKLKSYGITCYMSFKNNCWENTLTEGWFNSLKNERIHGRRFVTQAQMKAEGFEYIEVFYNRKRMHSTLNYKTRTQFLQDWISNQDKQKQVA